MIDVQGLIHYGKEIRLLYVEDDKDVSDSTSRLLKKFFPLLDVSFNGEEGLHQFLKKDYDIIITDIRMPILDGIGMIQEMKKEETEEKKIPHIIVTSAYTDTEYLLELIELQVNTFIPKPIDYRIAFHTLLKICIQIEDQKELKEHRIQLESKVVSLRSLAMNSMRESGFLGELIQFNNQSFHSHQEICEKVFSFLSQNMDLSAGVCYCAEEESFEEKELNFYGEFSLAEKKLCQEALATQQRTLKLPPHLVCHDGNLVVVIRFEEEIDDRLEDHLSHFLIVASSALKKVSLQQSVREKAESIKNLLNNVGQGFLSFGENFCIASEYSQICEQFFGKRIGGRNILDLAFQEERKKIEELFCLYFQQDTNLDLLIDLLPQEIVIDKLILSLVYRGIELAPKKEKGMMMILSDVTAEKKLQRKLEEEEEQNTLILKVMKDQQGFQQNVKEMQGIFQLLSSALEQFSQDTNLNEVYRWLHTIKGASATFSMKKVTEMTHGVESKLEKMKLLWNQENSAQLHLEIKELKQVFDHSLKQLSNLFELDEIESQEEIYPLPESKIKNVELMLKDGDKLENILFYLKQQPIKKILNNYARSAESLAERLKKRISIELVGGENEFYLKPLEPLFNSIIHLIRNSVDHGFELPEEREMLGKNPVGTLRIEVEKTKEELQLQIMDDGAGIDEEKIKRIAAEKKLFQQEQLEQLNREALIALLFAPGFSTKETTTDISGRGIGLNSVRTDVEKLGGEIQVRTRLDEGTVFSIRVPLRDLFS